MNLNQISKLLGFLGIFSVVGGIFLSNLAFFLSFILWVAMGIVKISSEIQISSSQKV